jgi:hypothetical protein
VEFTAIRLRFDLDTDASPDVNGLTTSTRAAGRETSTGASTGEAPVGDVWAADPKHVASVRWREPDRSEGSRLRVPSWRLPPLPLLLPLPLTSWLHRRVSAVVEMVDVDLRA